MRKVYDSREGLQLNAILPLAAHCGRFVNASAVQFQRVGFAAGLMAGDPTLLGFSRSKAGISPTYQTPLL